MTPELLTRAAIALHGPSFHPALARELETSVRTVQRWCAGTAEIPPGVLGELRGLLKLKRVNTEYRVATLSTLLGEMGG